MNEKYFFAAVIAALVLPAIAFSASVIDVSPPENALLNNASDYISAEFSEDVVLLSMKLDGVAVDTKFYGDFAVSAQPIGNLTYGEHKASVNFRDSSGEAIYEWGFTFLSPEASINSYQLPPNSSSKEISSEDDNIVLILSTRDNATIFMTSINTIPAYVGLNAVGRFAAITVDNISAIVFPVTLKMLYMDEDVSKSGVTESNLAIYFYNESSKTWQKETTTVDAAGNTVSTNLNHLSTFGVFEPASQTPPPPSGGSSGGTGGGAGGGGGGGGGSGSKPQAKNATSNATASNATTQTNQQQVQEQPSQQQQQTETVTGTTTQPQNYNWLTAFVTANPTGVAVAGVAAVVIAFAGWRMWKKPGKKK